MIGFSETPVHPAREIKKLSPILLSSSEVLRKAKIDFINQPQLESPKLEAFVNDHVRIVRMGNTDITIIDQEHDEHKGELNPLLTAYLTHQRTKTAVVEYFMPELQRNASKTPEFVKKNIISVDGIIDEGRGSMFMDIAEIMKINGKSVSCVDIANKLSYESYYALMKGKALPAFAALIPQIPLSPIDRLLLSTIMPLVSWSGDSVLEMLGKGIYDKQKISLLENLALSMEDGRRVYAAAGLKVLAQDYNKEYPTQNMNQQDNNNHPQIIVVYPRAHATRIANYMTSESTFTKAAKSAKQFLYYLPGLDYSYRTYEWKDILAKATDKPELASWQLTTSRKIGPFN